MDPRPVRTAVLHPCILSGRQMTHAFADENMLVSRVKNFLKQCGVSDLDQPLLDSFMHIYWPEGVEKKVAINNALYSNFINVKIDTDNEFFDDFDRSEYLGIVFFYTIEQESEKTFFRLYVGYIDLELTPKHREAFAIKSITFSNDYLIKRSDQSINKFFDTSRAYEAIKKEIENTVETLEDSVEQLPKEISEEDWMGEI